MAETTNRLNNKANILAQQIENDELAIFQHELTVQDFSTLPTDASEEVKSRLLGPKKQAELEIALCQQRLAVRKPVFDALKAQLEASKPAQAAAT